MKKHLMTFCLCLAPTLVMSEAGKPGGHFIENWDLNSDGSVSLDETRERRSDIFTTFDEDENRLLNAEEYKAFDAAREADMAENGDHGRGPMKKVAQGMQAAFNDINKDGQVSREEFLTQSDAFFSNMDRNADGVVSSADFGR